MIVWWFAHFAPAMRRSTAVQWNKWFCMPSKVFTGWGAANNRQMPLCTEHHHTHYTISLLQSFAVPKWLLSNAAERKSTNQRKQEKSKTIIENTFVVFHKRARHSICWSLDVCRCFSLPLPKQNGIYQFRPEIQISSIFTRRSLSCWAVGWRVVAFDLGTFISASRHKLPTHHYSLTSF